MFPSSRQLGASASLPVPISAPLSPPDEHDAHIGGPDNGGGSSWHPSKRGHARASSSISGALGMHTGPPSGAGAGTGVRGEMDPPRTIERRRKGRMVDMISALPTPPRTKDTRLDPTPPHRSTLSSAHRNLAPVPSTEMVTSDPTFAYSSSWHPTSGGRHDAAEIKLTRRPGLTFAQQMAAAAAQSGPGSCEGFVGRIHGVGVGMGGTRLSHSREAGGKIDDLFPTLSGRTRDHALLGPAPIEDQDGGNPFLAPAAKVSPGADVNMDAAPETPTTATSSLFTTPPAADSLSTPHNQPPAFTAPSAPQKRKWAAPIVCDEEDNPFYVKPGTAMGPPPPCMENMHEKPTVDYVFRGTKTRFANPHYRMPAGDTAQSRLPLSHPDFSPAPAPKPRLLWPAREASPTPGTNDDVDMDEEEIKPQKLFFTARSGVKHAREEDEAENSAKRPRGLRL